MNHDSSQWWVYLLRGRDDSLYTGITTDVARRQRQHNGELAGGAKALRGKRPLVLCWSLAVRDRSEASRLETQIKSWSKTKKEALVSGKAEFSF